MQSEISNKNLTAAENEKSFNGYLSPATVVEGPADVMALRGDTVSLKVTYIGDPEPTVDWMRAVCMNISLYNFLFLPIVDKSHFSQFSRIFFYFRIIKLNNLIINLLILLQGHTLTPSDRISIYTENCASILKIEGITADDGGKYEIHVENDQGSDTHVASLAVEGINTETMLGTFSYVFKEHLQKYLLRRISRCAKWAT